MRPTATRIALLAAALALAAAPAAAGAKPKKKKKAKATPVSVVSASKTTSGDGELVTVTASCPAGKIVVGGGFESPAFPGGTVTDLNLVHESRRASSASWQVSAVREDTGGAGPALAVTALAYCRTPKLKPKATKKAAAAKKKKKKKKKKKLKITEVSATSAPAPGSGIASATATCPGTQTPISGGFSSSPPPVTGFPFFYANLRSTANAWTATAFNSGPDPRTVSSYAYCIRPPGPTEKVGSATLPGGSAGPPPVFGTATATTPACSKSTSLVAGGFSHTPPSLTPGTAIPLATSSVGSGKSWSAGALNLGLGAGSLGARGYCL